MIRDHAARARRALIKSAETRAIVEAADAALARRRDPAAHLERKRADALAFLGDRWVLSPSYVFNPRHDPRGETFPRTRSIANV